MSEYKKTSSSNMNVNAAVTSLLRKYAGKYLEGLDADKISVGLGTTVLKDLVLSMNDLCQIYLYLYPLLTTSIIVCNTRCAAAVPTFNHFYYCVCNKRCAATEKHGF